MNGELDYIKRNLYSVMERIEKAAQKSGRSAKDITLVAVTKTVEPERIMKILDEVLWIWVKIGSGINKKVRYIKQQEM